MAPTFCRSLTMVVMLAAAIPAPLFAQPAYGTYGAPDGYAPAPYGAASVAASFSQDELDALLAPLALYPDQLLAQVLMAATFPLDVVEAARFVRERPGLTGAALDDALAGKRWDPSVLSLCAFPQVLDMMSERLEWTRRLGAVFMADQDRVMQTVQDLRRRARDAGTLMDTPQQRVLYDDRSIVIEPANPELIYVPVYNPTVVYGPWWAPAYVPYYWRPSRAYYATVVTTGVIGFGVGYYVSGHHWGWARPDWRQRHIFVDLGRPNRFIERRPYYRDWVRDGRWQRGNDWRDRRDQRPGGNHVAPNRDGYRPPRADARPVPPAAVRSEVRAVPAPGARSGNEPGNEAGSGRAVAPQFREGPRSYNAERRVPVQPQHTVPSRGAAPPVHPPAVSSAPPAALAPGAPPPAMVQSAPAPRAVPGGPAHGRGAQAAPALRAERPAQVVAPAHPGGNEAGSR